MSISKYIVSIFTYNGDSTYTQFGDGLLKIEGSKLELSYEKEKEEIKLIEESIKGNSIYILSNVKTKSNTYDFEIVINNIRFGIRFDSSSSESKNNFVKEFEKQKSSSIKQSMYPSGNLHIEGVQCDGNFGENCIEYYDSPVRIIKYVGDFEDCEYDGSGTFYSQNGLFRLVIPNICSNRPNGLVTLYIANEKNKEINWDDNKELSELDITSDTFIEEVLKIISIDSYKNIVEKAKFRTLSLDEKLDYLYDNMNNDTVIQKIYEKNNSFKHWFFSITIIYIIYFVVFKLVISFM